MKLKKIASLALAGIMAVSMFAGCAETNANSTPTPTPTPTPVSGASNVFAAELNNLASVKITMADDANLQTALNAAAGNIGSATIIDFTNAVRAAGHAWGGVRTIANFDANYNVYIADVNAGDAIVSLGPWDLVTNVPAGDLGVVAGNLAQEILKVLLFHGTALGDIGDITLQIVNDLILGLKGQQIIDDAHRETPVGWKIRNTVFHAINIGGFCQGSPLDRAGVFCDNFANSSAFSGPFSPFHGALFLPTLPPCMRGQPPCRRKRLLPSGGDVAGIPLGRPPW